MESDLTLRTVPRLWTFVHVHEQEGKREKINENTVTSWRHVAAAADNALAGIDHRGLDAEVLLREATYFLSGARLDDLRENQMRYAHDSSFRQARLNPLRRAYGLDDLDPYHDHPPARVLIGLAGEFRFLPYAEGALGAIKRWPSSARANVRTAFHTVTRWASQHSPCLARLVATAFSPRGISKSWPPLTRFYEEVLAFHRHERGRRVFEAEELSRRTIQELFDGINTDATHGEVLRALMTAAEELGTLPPRPRFERDESERRVNELARLTLDIDLDRELDLETEALIPLLQEAHSDASA